MRPLRLVAAGQADVCRLLEGMGVLGDGARGARCWTECCGGGAGRSGVFGFCRGYGWLGSVSLQGVGAIGRRCGVMVEDQGYSFGRVFRQGIAGAGGGSGGGGGVPVPQREGPWLSTCPAFKNGATQKLPE